jgi:hypothetical protein
MKAVERITKFRGSHAFLSNFWSCPVYFDEEVYGSAEAAFQAAKTDDLKWRERIRHADTPVEAKQLGRQAPLRPDWEKTRVDIMRQILVSKFSNEPLRQKLLATAPAFLEEGNTWGDRFWGTVDGIGINMLGKLLMELRNT